MKEDSLVDRAQLGKINTREYRMYAHMSFSLLPIIITPKKMIIKSETSSERHARFLFYRISVLRGRAKSKSHEFDR